MEETKPDVSDTTAKTQKKKGVLFSQSKNGASRCKWLFGLYAGLIAIIGNHLFDDLGSTNKWVILLSLIGAVINAFAMTNFEKIQFELERELLTGNNGIDSAKAGYDAGNSLNSTYNWAIGLMTFAILFGFSAGIVLVWGMFGINLPVCSQT